MTSNLDREGLLDRIGMNLVFTRVSGFFRASTYFPCSEAFSAPLGARKSLSPTDMKIETTLKPDLLPSLVGHTANLGGR
jgi:hypothetical protein